MIDCGWGVVSVCISGKVKESYMMPVGIVYGSFFAEGNIL